MDAIPSRCVGPQGVKVKQELEGLVGDLPGTFRKVVEALCGERVGEAMEYYEAFVAYAHAPDQVTAGKGGLTWG